MKKPTGAELGISWRRILFVTLPCVVAPALSRAASAAPGTVFVPVTPCRIVDTRAGSSPGKLVPPTVYAYKVALANYSSQGGNAAGCGVPLTVSGNNSVSAVALNVVAVAPTGDGDMRMWPADAAPPVASVINYAAVAGLNLANGIVVAICQSGCTTADIDVQAQVHGAYLVADVTGYFVAGSTALTLPYTGTGSDANAAFQATNTGSGNGVVGLTSSGASGVYGGSPNGAGYGVAGRAGGGSGIPAATRTGTFGDSDTGYGVLGESNKSDGVHGVSNSLSGVFGGSVSGDGVHGMSNSLSGVFGGSSSGAGVWGESAGYDGVHGHTSNSNGNTSGVAGFGDGSNTGVLGVSFAGRGVFGTSNGPGVWGESSDNDGVHGHASYGSGATSGVAGLGDDYSNGVFGLSGSGKGVVGVSSGVGGTGVFGTNSAGGYGMGTDAHAFQSLGKAGWVKALIDVAQDDGTIRSCFNSQLPAPASTTPPCGFTLHEPQVGEIQIDLGFPVASVFPMVSVSGDGTYSRLANIGFCPNSVSAGECKLSSGTVLEVGVYDSSFDPSEALDVYIVLF